jgi:leader peptidase (prepilin peptidase)/N-methyltransferase
MQLTEMTTVYFIYAFVFFFGAIVGSFLNVCIYRLPLGKSIVTPPSSCPKCGKRIKWYDNIPIFGWLMLGGKCRFCKNPISIRYPLIELLTGLLSLATLIYLGSITAYLLIFCFFIAPMIVVTFIDLDYQLIPDIITVPGTIIGFLIHIALFPDMLSYKIFNSVAGIVVGGGFLFVVGWLFLIIKKQEGLGGGDVKLMAMIGAFFGWKAALFTIIVSALIGSVVGVTYILISKKDMQLAIPFGPFIVAAAFLYFFFGQQIMYWYFNLLY